VEYNLYSDKTPITGRVEYNLWDFAWQT
jgi:hypothetical protein